MVTLKFLLKLASSGPHREFLLPAFFRVCFLSVFFFSWLYFFVSCKNVCNFCWKLDIFNYRSQVPPFLGLVIIFLLIYLVTGWIILVRSISTSALTVETSDISPQRVQPWVCSQSPGIIWSWQGSLSLSLSLTTLSC